MDCRPASLGPVSYFDNQTSIGTGAYALSLSMQPLNNAVPEPASIGLLGMRMMRRKVA